MSLKTFTYKGDIYIRAVPGKNLFRSTMVHEVVNRGDVFAIRVSDQILTIIPGTAEVTHNEHTISAIKASNAGRKSKKSAGRKSPSSEESGQGELFVSGDAL